MIRARLAGMVGEWRRIRAGRIAMGRSPWWWLSDTEPGWILRRYEDARVIATIVFVCGSRGHRFEIIERIPCGDTYLGGFTACGRCGTHLEDLP